MASRVGFCRRFATGDLDLPFTVGLTPQATFCRRFATGDLDLPFAVGLTPQATFCRRFATGDLDLPFAVGHHRAALPGRWTASQRLMTVHFGHNSAKSGTLGASQTPKQRENQGLFFSAKVSLWIKFELNLCVHQGSAGASGESKKHTRRWLVQQLGASVKTIWHNENPDNCPGKPDCKFCSLYNCNSVQR